ncbi:type I restriction-modification system endonuclease [Prosthecobacter sp.]|uniref:type I restriction-modification system endonuclease n=1 Tax=Prosthecobacter sp. TaxID=1965333 RepID=UPI0024883351|nr:type I restriction-modification system endonuclease [Prosthecobacter sp.]MDI1313516.1 type I restriction-modification system endonuclease [Prosthecobacter sp.]
MPAPALRSNFTHLQEHDAQLLRLGMLAERYFAEDPNTCLLKLRQLAEVLAQAVASHVGLLDRPEEGQYELLGRLRDQGILPREMWQIFGEVRRSGNAANHALSGDHRTALTTMKLAWQIGVWFHRTFKDPKFKSGPFIPPQPPADETDELRAELDSLTQALATYQSAHQEKEQLLASTEAQLKAAKTEQSFWEQMAAEVEAEKNALQARLASQQAETVTQPAAAVAALVSASNEAAKHVQLDEAATRKLIDSQLRLAGWEVDTENLRFSKGTRPKKGKNLAIAEWPTGTGPADYILFVGLTPMATVEAKRKNVNVSASLQQAARYARGFTATEETEMHATNWGAKSEFRLPFIFSANGRPYLRQIETESGIWFRDIRRPDNLGHALDGWYSPEGLTALLKRDEAAAHAQLATETFDYGFTVRDYQQRAILATEAGIARGLRALLLAMATGTGKTKTCIALIYRLLKTKRFRRILFLVDRSALGEQAANAFKDTRMESSRSFAHTFGIKELDEASPDTETAVHIATIQGMVKRVLFPSEGSTPPSVDQYDCIIVDECHRGYLLDRELSDTEMSFRGFEDYISKYRRVLDYFDAVKIGLTATPALHTTDIFGPPIYTYSYRDAVIDGHLIDHEPPFIIKTELSESGIVWQKGQDVEVYKNKEGQIELFKAPDEIKIEIENFNRRVITKPFNEVVCDYLAKELDPTSRQKTLVFCATDAHADLVVDLLKTAFKKLWGSVDDDAVIKITGAADKPLHLIRRYKNERNPVIAVTVDLLTTGIDVPEICNIVFLRRVNSRILFDQMLGRATRQCDDIGKETFRIYDAVRIYEALQDITAMKPVVVDPGISFTQLAKELTTVTTDEARTLVRDQLLAKFQRKKRHLTERAMHDFEARAGMTPEEFVKHLHQVPLDQLAKWFVERQDLGEILDRKNDGPSVPVFISNHTDAFVSADRGYGKATKPEDFLNEFRQFIKTMGNKLPALLTVVTRPRELTRQQLRELQYELDKAGFSETNLATAYRETTNQEIAAKIIGYIRQAALGDALVPYDQRVDSALQKMLASRAWSTPQREWLKKLASQTKANLLVDRAALDDPVLIFKREGGGFNRLNRLFDGQLQQVLENFNDTLWQPAA